MFPKKPEEEEEGEETVLKGKFPIFLSLFKFKLQLREMDLLSNLTQQ